MAFVRFAFYFEIPHPLILNISLFPKNHSFYFWTLPLSDLDETSYIDSVWDGIFGVCIFFNSPPPQIPPLYTLNQSPYFCKTFSLSDSDQTSYIITFWNSICVIFIFFQSSPPTPETFPIFFNAFSLSELDEIWVFFLTNNLQIPPLLSLPLKKSRC